MSASTILKNIFEFAKILNRASHQNVTQWDEQSMKNALDWTDYCHEMFTQIKGQEYEEDVNNQLSQMAVFLEPVSCLRLSVDSLGCARTLLVESLMSNPRFPPSSQKKLIRILHGSQDGVKVLEEVQQKISESNNRLQICTDLLNELMDRSDTSSLHAFESEFQAKVLMQNLVAAVQNVKKIERFEKYCCAVYNKLTATQEGWNILVHMFTVEVGGLPFVGALEEGKILSDFLSRMRQGIEENVSASHLWDVPTDVLVSASIASENFFLTYLDALMALGDSCFPQIHGRGLILWRSANGLTVKELCHHFQRLLESSASLSQDRKVKILGAITDRVRGTDFTVWREVVQNLLLIFGHG